MNTRCCWSATSRFQSESGRTRMGSLSGKSECRWLWVGSGEAASSRSLLGCCYPKFLWIPFQTCELLGHLHLVSVSLGPSCVMLLLVCEGVSMLAREWDFSRTEIVFLYLGIHSAERSGVLKFRSQSGSG